MRCPECGRPRNATAVVTPDKSPYELRNRLRGCQCTDQHEALLRLLSLLATCGMDPQAPPVLGSPTAS